MQPLTKELIEQAIAKYIDPYLGVDLLTAKMIKDINIDGANITIIVNLGYPFAGYERELKAAITKPVMALAGVDKVTLKLGCDIVAHTVQQGIKLIPQVKNMIAVASGKGGVGKSTTAVNLALALQAEGAKVGILDADIYGPNQPQMLGSQQKPESKDGKILEPVMCHGLQTMSIGYLIDQNTAMIWRGPMVTTALQQLLNETRWHDLDYLIIDLPPGTGDIQLTLAQKIPVSGAVIVTTPQDVALLDAKKALAMFGKVRVPVLGVIENMSTHICSQCGHQEPIFGEGGGKRFAKEFAVDLLGALPLEISIRQQADLGKPTVVATPDGDIAKIYRDIARRLAAKLSLKAKDYAHKFPNIVIEND